MPITQRVTIRTETSGPLNPWGSAWGTSWSTAWAIAGSEIPNNSDFQTIRIGEDAEVCRTRRVAYVDYLLLEGDMQDGDDHLLFEDGSDVILDGDAISIRDNRTRRVLDG